MRSAFALFLSLPLMLSSASADLGALAKPQDGRSRRESSTFRKGADGWYDSKAKPLGDATDKSNWDNFRIKPGESHVVMNAKGPGVITHMWFTFLGPEPHDWAKQGSANHQEILLRIYWDNSKRPAVEVPFGDFFANCFGKRSEVLSIPVAVEDADSYNCFWHMPFRKAAKIELINQSEKPIHLLYYNIDWIEKKEISTDTPYLYAQYRQAYPVKKGEDYVVLETKGKGHYVGTVLGVRMRSPSWFGEGDEKIFIDGEKDASIWGTGTEDYFLSAWGLQQTSTAYFGVPYFDQWGIVGGHTSAYRWHIADPIVFNTGIRVAFEHWGWISPDENPEYKSTSWNEREDDYSSVAFWYQTGEPSPQPPVPPASERKLPSLERVLVLAKEFSDSPFHGAGKTEVQQLKVLDYPQLLYTPQSKENAWIEIPFKIEKKEPLRLVLNVSQADDFGQYQAYLDGIKVGEPIDLYSKRLSAREFHLLDFWPEHGEHKLRLECVGKNPLSNGHLLGLESVRLRERRPRVAKMGWDKDKDWQKDPVLYR